MGANDFVGKGFAKIFNKHKLGVEVVRVLKEETPLYSDWNAYDGIVVTGSSYFVTEKHKWSVSTGEKLAQIVKTGITPVLAVCYGHQLIMDTLGGEVQFMKVRQIGSKICHLTEDSSTDPLFSSFFIGKMLHSFPYPLYQSRFLRDVMTILSMHVELATGVGPSSFIQSWTPEISVL
jgi:GMP synthase-like glutamine amidotransferase